MAKDSAINFQVVDIGPDEARKLVGSFMSLGKVDPKLVRAYAEDMASQRWLLNGASIVISKDQKILDGRARLLACIQAKVSFRTLVISDIDSSAFETIDAVRKRRLADVLTIRHFQHGRALAAALRIIHAFRRDVLPLARSPSPIVLLDLIESHPEIRDSVLPNADLAG
jgi:hypothetical protein